MYNGALLTAHIDDDMSAPHKPNHLINPPVVGGVWVINWGTQHYQMGHGQLNGRNLYNVAWLSGCRLFRLWLQIMSPEQDGSILIQVNLVLSLQWEEEEISHPSL